MTVYEYDEVMSDLHMLCQKNKEKVLCSKTPTQRVHEARKLTGRLSEATLECQLLSIVEQI